MNNGFILSNASEMLTNLPEPYRSWNSNSTDTAAISVLNQTRTTALPHTEGINGEITAALLAYTQGAQSEYGVVRLQNGAYVGEQILVNGNAPVYHVAAISSNGSFQAAKITEIPGQTNKYTATSVPSIGMRKHTHNCTLYLLMLMMIRADQTKAAGITEQAITWQLLDDAKATVAGGSPIPERTVRLVNDDLRWAIALDAVKLTVQQGAIDQFDANNITNGTYRTATTVCGKPTLLVPNTAGAQDDEPFPAMNLADAKAMARAYTDTLVWTDEEKFFIPQMPDDTIVPPEVVEILTRFLATRGTNKPLTNPCWRGRTGYGKSYGVKILAAILNTPLVYMTCSTNTETTDFIAKLIPDTSENASRPFKVVESDFVQALANGYICEVQEFSRIRDSGVLVGLNNLSDPSGVVTLVDGTHRYRHPDAIICWTDNVGLASCRNVDASVLRRFSYVIDSDEMAKEAAVARVAKNTGFADEDLLNRMYEVWSRINTYCQDNDINSEGMCSLPDLETWAWLVKMDGKSALKRDCRIAIVNKLSSDPITQAEIMDGAVVPAMASNGL